MIMSTSPLSPRAPGSSPGASPNPATSATRPRPSSVTTDLPCSNVVTTPDATEVPSHIPPEDAKGFALSLGKMVLDGGVGEVANIARLNVRNIPRP